MEEAVDSAQPSASIDILPPDDEVETEVEEEILHSDLPREIAEESAVRNIVKEGIEERKTTVRPGGAKTLWLPGEELCEEGLPVEDFVGKPLYELF